VTPDVSIWNTLAAYQTDFWSGLVGTPFSDASVGGSVAVGTGDSTHPGVVVGSTSTSSTGVGAALTSITAVTLGGAAWVNEWLVRVPTLSTVAQEYIVRVGMIDSVSTDATDGVYFEYDRLTSGDVWRCKTASAASRTGTATTTAIVAGAWARLSLVVNAGGTQADFYVDGALAASLTATIPTGSGKETGFGFTIIKSAGTTARTLEIDRALWRASLSTPR